MRVFPVFASYIELMEQEFDRMHPGTGYVTDQLYGRHNIQAYFIRFFLCVQHRWLFVIYAQYGCAWDKWLKRYPYLKVIFKPIWDYMANRGEDLLLQAAYLLHWRERSYGYKKYFESA